MPEISVDELSREQCMMRIGQVKLGRIAISVRALPVIVPVEFATIAGSVIVRPLLGIDLGSSTANNVIAFHVDDFGTDGESGWSVLVQGLATEVTDPALRDASREALGPAPDVADVAERIVKLQIYRITGRQFVTAPD